MDFLPPRTRRWGLVGFGILFVVQGLGKAIDPRGYMAALDAFHVLRPTAFESLSLGSLALLWTVLELLAGVAMLYGGLSRAPAKQLSLGGISLALGLTVASLSLTIGALGRHLPIANTTVFGSYAAQSLSWLVIAQEAIALGLLSWLFTSVLKWPSLEHAHEPPAHRRSPLAAWFTAP